MNEFWVRQQQYPADIRRPAFRALGAHQMAFEKRLCREEERHFRRNDILFGEITPKGAVQTQQLLIAAVRGGHRPTAPHTPLVALIAGKSLHNAPLIFWKLIWRVCAPSIQR